MRQTPSRSLVAVALALLPACGGVDESDLDLPGDGDEPIAWMEGIVARSGATSVTVVASTPSGGRARFAATANVPLTELYPFVIDDRVGSVRRSGSTWYLAFEPRELAQWLGGQPVFLALRWNAGGAAKTMTAKADLRAALTRSSGSTQLAPRAWFQAFVVDGRPVVRVRGTAGADVSAVSAKLYDETFAGRGSGREWILDVPADVFARAVAARRVLSLTVKAGSTTLRAGFKATATVARLALTTSDPYQVWAYPTCTASLRGCLSSAGADTSACGDAFTVSRCPPAQGGLTVTQAELPGWIDQAIAGSVNAYRADFARMLGDARALELVNAAKDLAAEDLSGLVGRSFPDAERVVAAVKPAALAALDRALAHPMQHLPPTRPVPGSVATARTIALEGVLGWLDTHDLTNTEYGRPLETVIREHRDRWVGNCEAMRLGTGETEVRTEAAEYIVIGRMLSAYVEVRVSRSTGAATDVYFEID